MGDDYIVGVKARLQRLGRNAMLKGVTCEMWRRCPHCGETTARVYSMSYTLRYYDMADPWGPDFAWMDDDFPEEHFIMEAQCTECDTDVSHLVPGARLRDEWGYGKLIDTLEVMVEGYDNWRNSVNQTDAIAVWTETVRKAREALALVI